MSLFKRNHGKVVSDDRKEPRDSQYDERLYGEIRTDEVDIPLNEDLSEFQDNLLNSRAKIDSVDIDLTDITGQIAAPGEEARLLTVNPLKPFSNQVSLNLRALAEKGYVTPAEPRTLLSRAFRRIKRPIVNIARGKGSVIPGHPNLIMITSSLNGEGKSYTAINLAMSIAMERDQHVLLIDADIIKPSHHQIFDVNVHYGLTDLLLGKAKNMSEVLCKTNIPSLSLMFAGTQVSHATELLASQAMDDFIADISKRYQDRIIIFDTPPLLLTTEASVLAPGMGQVVVVVEAEATSKHLLDQSLKQLSNDVIMLMLNKVRVKDDEQSYDYYGYGQQAENP